ncbi:MAG: hypothetical protein SNJ77_06020 [Cytophagales bacterium]
MRKKKLLFKILIVLVMLVNIANGYIRHDYLLNFSDDEKPFFLKRKDFKGKLYPTDVNEMKESLNNDYRWISTGYYTVFAIVSTVLVVYLLFENRGYVLVSLALYGLVIVFIGFLVLLSFLTKNYAVGYGIAQYFKNLIQTPLFSFLIVACLFLIEKRKRLT